MTQSQIEKIRDLLIERMGDSGADVESILRAIRTLEQPPEFDARLKAVEARVTLLESVRNWK